MTSYNTYPNLPSAPPEAPQVAYHLNVVQAKRRRLIAKEQMFKQKYEKYTKILNRLTWLNTCLSGISVATGISSVTTFATFIGLPVSISLGAASLTGVIASGIISMLTKKYQKKLKKVTKLIDTITPVLVVFERVVSGALKDSIIDKEEFNMLQTLHLETHNKMMGIDRRMEAEHRSLVEKSLLEEINNIKKDAGTKLNGLLAVLFCVLLSKWIKSTTNLITFEKDKKPLRSCENLMGRNLRQLSNGYLGKHFGKYIYQLWHIPIDLIAR